MKPWVKSEFSFFAFAKTGRGKTVTANAIHAGTDRLSIFWNCQRKPYIRGKTVHYSGSSDDGKLAEIVRSGADKIDVQPTNDDPETLAALVDWCWPLASSGVRLMLTVDEAVDYAPNGSKGTPVHRLMKRGREPGDSEGGIKGGLISQRYSEVEKSARSEAEYLIIVGIPDKGDWDRLEKVGIDMAELENRHSQDKFIATVDGGESVSRAVSVYRGGERIQGPMLTASRYAE